MRDIQWLCSHSGGGEPIGKYCQRAAALAPVNGHDERGPSDMGHPSASSAGFRPLDRGGLPARADRRDVLAARSCADAVGRDHMAERFHAGLTRGHAIKAVPLVTTLTEH